VSAAESEAVPSSLRIQECEQERLYYNNTTCIQECPAQFADGRKNKMHHLLMLLSGRTPAIIGASDKIDQIMNWRDVCGGTTPFPFSAEKEKLPTTPRTPASEFDGTSTLGYSTRS